MPELSNIRFIEAEHKKILQNMGIETCEDLIKLCKTSIDRKKFAMSAGLDHLILDEMVKCADLMRIPRIRQEYVLLLRKVGIHCINDLARQNTRKLYAKIFDLAVKDNLTERIPFEHDVHEWIGEAVKLQKKVLFE